MNVVEVKKMIIEKRAYSKQMKMCVESNRKMGRFLRFDENAGNVNWKLVRFISNLSYMLVAKNKNVKYHKIKGKINGYECIPSELRNDDIVICIHGGGTLCGSAYGSLGFATDVAAKAGMKVYCLEYGLAPEHKFPEGIDDIYEAYQEIVRLHPSSNIFVTGESAGAYLTIALTCLCIKNKIRKPAAIFPHSPVIDFTGAVDRSAYEVKDPLLKEGSIEAIGELYCPNEDRTDYRISPLYFDEFAQFPPTLITVDANEYLRGDSEKLHQILVEKGVETKLYLYHNTYHAFGVTGTMTPETDEILEETIDLMKNVSKI